MKKYVWLVGSIVLLLALAPGSGLQAADGDVLWTDNVDVDGGWDFAFDSDADAGLVFATGTGNFSSDDATAITRAYDSQTGELVWSDRFDVAAEVRVLNLAAHQGRVFVSGFAGDCTGYPTSDCNALVLAYERGTGALLWSDRFDLAGGYDRVIGLATQGDQIFLAGTGLGTDGTVNGFVLSYDARTGALTWSDEFDRAGSRDFLWDVAVSGDRVFASGFASVNHDEDAVVRAYDAHTGEVAWTEYFDLAGEGQFDRFFNIVAQGDVVVAAGHGRQPGRPPIDDDRIIRAFDARSGQPLWTRHFAQGNVNRYTELAVSGNRLIASGFTGVCGERRGAGEDCDLVVQAFDLRTGTLHWEDRLDGGGPFDRGDGIAVSGDRVYAVGTSGPDCAAFHDAGCDGIIRAYDAQTGEVVWSDLFDRAGGLDRFWDVTVYAGRVFTVGVSSSEPTDDTSKRDFLVRAYDAR